MIQIKGRMCTSNLSKTIGLMFSKKKILIFDMKKLMIIRLHMFFVFFPINVYLLDEDRKVIEIKNDFKPFTFFNSKKQARFVIECPKHLNLKINDQVSF